MPLLGLVLLFSCSKDSVTTTEEKNEPSISLNASPRTSTIAVPFDEYVYVSCSNGGAGELVHLTGLTNYLYTISWTDHGFTYGYHSNTYQITGEGLSSGETFHGTGNNSGQVFGSWVNDHWVSTFVDQLKLIGQTTRFTLKRTYHVTVSPDDQVSVTLDNYQGICE